MKPINDRIPIKIGKETLLFPAGWHHISLAQTLIIYNPATGPKSTLDIMSTLVGKPVEFWFRVDRMDLEKHLVPHLVWFNQQFDFHSLPLPPSVTIDGKAIRVPKDIGMKSWGQRMAFAQEVQTCAETYKDSEPAVRNFHHAFGLIPYTLALYFYEEYYGVKFEDDFDDEKVREFANTKIVTLPITEAYPIAAFFLLNLSES
jgi:hypothetical protein